MIYAIRLHALNAGDVRTISATFEADRAWRRPQRAEIADEVSYAAQEAWFRPGPIHRTTEPIR
jgi:hypothetical protein